MSLKSRFQNINVSGACSTIDDIWIVNDKRVCTAVHPDHPHLLNDGHSRGRKIHLDKGDEIHTVCNMLVGGYIAEQYKDGSSMVNNGKCKICFKDNQ